MLAITSSEVAEDMDTCGVNNKYDYLREIMAVYFSNKYLMINSMYSRKRIPKTLIQASRTTTD